MLTTLILIPLVGAIVTAILPAQTARRVGLVFGLVTLAVAITMAAQYDVGGGWQFTEQHQWINLFGAHYALGVDGLGLVMILLTVVLVPVVLVAAWREDDAGVAKYFAWALALESASVAVFAATDVFLFYVFFEVMLVPMYFIIGSFGGPRRQYAAMKFFIYSLVGGLVMLAAVIGLYVVSSQHLAQGTFAFIASESKTPRVTL